MPSDDCYREISDDIGSLKGQIGGIDKRLDKQDRDFDARIERLQRDMLTILARIEKKTDEGTAVCYEGHTRAIRLESFAEATGKAIVQATHEIRENASRIAAMNEKIKEIEVANAGVRLAALEKKNELRDAKVEIAALLGSKLFYFVVLPITGVAVKGAEYVLENIWPLLKK